MITKLMNNRNFRNMESAGASNPAKDRSGLKPLLAGSANPGLKAGVILEAKVAHSPIPSTSKDVSIDQTFSPGLLLNAF
jgi:hypothetical protein